MAANYKRGPGRAGGGGSIGGQAHGFSPDSIWTDQQRNLFRQALEFDKAIFAADKEREALVDELSILVKQMHETGMKKGRLCQIFSISHPQLVDLLERGNTAQAIKELEGK